MTEPSEEAMRVGDIITIAGVNQMVTNPCRRWWQFWKPRMLDSGVPQEFTVTTTSDNH